MNKTQSDALRKPFPKEAVGLLPKPYKRDSQKGNCQDCGGYHGLPAVHLDYVGHAAVTDRLLAVDPEWTWEPMATDQFGSPQQDRDGNLWIRLTVGGLTRIGVGDGSSMKERIGDAIRNAAMRFGVALDLWSKEELEGAHGEAEKAEKPTQAHEPWPEAVAGKTVSDAQIALMGTLMKKLGMTDRDLALEYVKSVINREVASRKDLTVNEASAVIERLKEDDKAGAPA